MPQVLKVGKAGPLSGAIFREKGHEEPLHPAADSALSFHTLSHLWVPVTWPLDTRLWKGAIHKLLYVTKGKGKSQKSALLCGKLNLSCSFRSASQCCLGPEQSELLWGSLVHLGPSDSGLFSLLPLGSPTCGLQWTSEARTRATPALNLGVAGLIGTFRPPGDLEPHGLGAEPGPAAAPA